MSLSSACSYESIWNEKKKLRTGFHILCSLVGALPNFQKMFNMEEITIKPLSM